ncbi:CynX/NimT family MFS transporter [Corynebacterium sp.]|uniref:CynX/NimT family MFS transporter n=1 Tax=Corynebacterium sp. TaxID=1720 RepID=UPI003B3BBEED
MTETTSPDVPYRDTGRGPVVPVALVVTGILLVAGNLRAAITTVGPVLTGIEDDLGISSSSASFLVSLPLLAFAVVSPLVPRVAHRTGLERIIVLGLVCLAVGLVMRSTPPIALLWVGTVLIGVAIAVLNVVLPALVKRDFPTKIGQVTGAYSAVQSGFAAVAAGVAVPVAGLTALGWRLPLGMWAGLALIATGAVLPQLWRSASPAPVPPPPESAGAAPVWRRALAWQVAAFMGLQSTNYYVLVTWLPSIEQDAGISGATAGTHLLLFNVFGIVGSLCCSALLSRLTDQRVLGVLIPVTLLIAVVGILLVPGLTGVWACIAGIGGGASIVLSLSLFGLRARHHTTAASLSGMAQSVGYILAALGPVVVGGLHDATGSWTPALSVLVVVDVAMLGVGLLVGRNRTVD